MKIYNVYAPQRLTSLPEKHIFVFGSNLKGIHGAGAARDAYRLFGASLYTGTGLTGNSYAIPTKDENFKVLSLDVINNHVQDFIKFAKLNKHLQFVVTPIGTGLAGYSDSAIAPMFKDIPINCIIPDYWLQQFPGDSGVATFF